jgi:2-polyprenyl-6-methoxyphenol hydroxylase-like FAD-dependent oxidoreductase
MSEEAMMVGADGGRAVVLGGSIAGLLAARVLSERGFDVRVLDRDELVAAGGRRRGVPQARHIHALLPRGREILEELFPGITAALVADGAPGGDLLADTRLHLSGHRFRRAESGLPTLSCSRTFLEDHVRSRVRVLPNVTFADPCDVVGLTTSRDRGRVTGVRLLRRADGSAEEVLDADLVVDALGRGSRLPTWLEALGYGRVEEERITVDLGYATCRYRLPLDALDGDWGTLQGPTPQNPRGGALARIEGESWMLTLFGLVGDHPPTDRDGFLAFAGSLPFDDIHAAVRDAEPLDDPTGFRFPASVRRRYERLADLPEGLLVVGDSICSLNPIYGQGMTVAGLAAVALREELRRSRRPASRRFHRELASTIDPPWDMVVGGDLAIPGVDGPANRTTAVLGAYIARLHAAAAHDPRLAIAFARVMALIDAPSTLLRPGVALRVLRPRPRPPRSPEVVGATTPTRPTVSSGPAGPTKEERP